MLDGRVTDGDLGALVTDITITADKVNRTVGFDLTEADIVRVFEQLGFNTEITNNDIHVKSHRVVAILRLKRI